MRPSGLISKSLANFRNQEANSHIIAESPLRFHRGNSKRTHNSLSNLHSSPRNLRSKSVLDIAIVLQKAKQIQDFRPTDMNIVAYTKRFNELALLSPDDVPNEKKKVELYIKGFPEIIKGETTSSRPATLNEVVRIAHTLMEQKIQDKAERITESNKRKWGSNNNNYHNNNQGNYRDKNRHNQYNDRRQGGARAMTTTQNDDADQGGPAPNCNRYGLCHFGQYPSK
ncbi:hypothetical protein Tco_0729849 [Tanacetum coccineum]|uniref:Ty3 transposon capsid-like protein domain-containing protein n=1 Tax=Tanacetum coccineum TaxID=301880 RepID=A0ABQ4YT60_9ASTR